jgi:hypothetical protein
VLCSVLSEVVEDTRVLSWLVGKGKKWGFQGEGMSTNFERTGRECI